MMLRLMTVSAAARGITLIPRSLLIAVCMLVAAPAARAIDPADDLRDALLRLPALQAEDLRRVDLASFFDVSAVVAMAAGDDRRLRHHMGRLSSPLASLHRLQHAAHVGDMQWIGTDLATIRTVIGWNPRDMGDTAVWRLRAAADVDALLGRLRARHHRPVPGAVPDVVTDARPLELLHNERLVDVSPWYGRSGASVLAAAGDLVLQAPTADEVARLRAVTPERSLGQDPAVRAMLRGFAGVSGRLIQAALYSPRIGLEQQAYGRAAAAGVPPYRLALMADLQDGDRAGMLIALAYADCGAAQVAAQRLASLWAATLAAGRSYADVSPAEVATRTVAEQDHCAAVAVFRSGSTAPDAVPVFVVARMALSDRELLLLRIVDEPRK